MICFHSLTHSHTHTHTHTHSLHWRQAKPRGRPLSLPGANCGAPSRRAFMSRPPNLTGITYPAPIMWQLSEQPQGERAIVCACVRARVCEKERERRERERERERGRRRVDASSYAKTVSWSYIAITHYYALTATLKERALGAEERNLWIPRVCRWVRGRRTRCCDLTVGWKKKKC